MRFRRVCHQNNPFSSHHRQLLRWFYSSTAPPPPAAVGGQTTPSRLGSVSQGCMFRSTKASTKGSDLKYPYGMRPNYFSTRTLVNHPEGGIVDVPLAQTGEVIAECELLKWFVQEGDQVEEFQPICEVQSDKATIEITSRYKGKVSEILYIPGDIVKVGETLLRMVVAETPISDQTADPLQSVEALDFSKGDSDVQNSVPRETKPDAVLSTTAVCLLAKQLGVDINDVHGTGKDGRVLKEDVHNYAANKGITKVDLASFSATEEQSHGDVCGDVSAANAWEYKDKIIQLREFQRAMVKSMTLATKVPHFYYVEEIICDSLMQLKPSFLQENSDPDVKFTFLPLLIKSLSMALRKHPMLNSCFSEERYEVTVKGSHNIGIAMATPHGLVVPNIKNVQSLSILEITKELTRLQKLALANKLGPHDISGGTITLSNSGAIGGKFGTPLVNVPEVSIIAIGRIQKVPRFAEDGSVNPASVMTVNIGADHRVLDGATVAMFCNDWRQYIQKPDILLLHTA